MGKVFRNLLFIICIIIFCFSAWKLYSIWNEYRIGEEIYSNVHDQVVLEDSEDGDGDKDENSLFVDMDKLQKINKYAIAWIRIPDTVIDYPVLHPEDNDQFLRHTITGEYNRAGSIFVEYQIEKPFEEAHTIIYGHNLMNGTMFNDLIKYKDKSFWESHKDIYIQFKGRIRVYRIYSCYKVETGTKTYTLGLQKDTEEYQDYLDWTMDHGIYSTGIVPENSQSIITLSTCTNEYASQRFVVHAVEYGYGDDS